jgi:RNA polymerase sigma-70 factor (ECF subfamily)
MTTVTIDADTIQQLVGQARQGDRTAADRIVREHAGWVRSAIYAVTGRVDGIDDIAQQVWQRVWQRLDGLEQPQRLRAWLYRIAQNTALDARQRYRRESQRVAPLEAAPDVDPRHRAPLGQLAAGEMQRAIVDAVQALPAIYREPLVLRHLEGWSYREIGEVLGLNVDTVETRLVRARRMLRDGLTDRIES